MINSPYRIFLGVANRVESDRLVCTEVCCPYQTIVGTVVVDIDDRVVVVVVPTRVADTVVYGLQSIITLFFSRAQAFSLIRIAPKIYSHIDFR